MMSRLRYALLLLTFMIVLPLSSGCGKGKNAAQARDQTAAKAAHGKLTESCKGCHQQHRGMGPRGG